MHDTADYLRGQGTTMTPETIGAAIRRTRKRLGMRQDELASVAGLSTRSVSAIENGKATARIGMVLQVLEALDITVSLTPPDLAMKPDHGADANTNVGKD